MQKLITKEEREKKERRNKFIIGIVLVGLMVISSAGYAFYGTEKTQTNSKVNYNGISFEMQSDGLWHFTIDTIEFSTSYNPYDTQNITTIKFPLIQNLMSKTLYFDSKSDYNSVNELSRNFGTIIPRVQFACSSNVSCTENYPIKDCSSNIILIEDGIKTLINTKDNCTFIYSNDSDFLRVSDAFLFKTLGVQ